MFFGFTHCPDICPTTLAELSALLTDLGDRSDGLQVVLVSGDPKRDTPEVLNAYLQPFDPRIVALTGPEAEVDRAFASFKAYRKKVPTEGGDYTIDHSAGVYLYDRDGGFAGTLDMHEDMKVKRAKGGATARGRGVTAEFNETCGSGRGSRAPCWRSSAGSGPLPGWCPEGSPLPHAVPAQGS